MMHVIESDAAANINQSDSDSKQERMTTDWQGSFMPGRDIKVEDYPDESTFVYKSHRKNIQLVRPPKADAFRLVSSIIYRTYKVTNYLFAYRTTPRTVLVTKTTIITMRKHQTPCQT